ncbi:T9SS type A sorting domain-containing protein, partial [Flavobacteriales bacterium]|nr:T9SS type A sorting domain-containing protein [Flavobacteriales bacterium]
GDYSSGRAIRSGYGWGNQHLILSRVNDASWSFPSFQNRQYLVLSFDVIHCHWGSMFRLAYDQNNDNNFGQNCGQPDPNEASFGLSYSTGVIRLLDANSQVVALDNYSAGSWVKAVAQDGSNVSGEKEVTITEAVGIEEIHSLVSNVYPNPTNGIIQIESTKEIKIISILSLRGKLVVKRESFSNRVDISNLKNGIYIIELLNTDSSKEHHQIIKN